MRVPKVFFRNVNSEPRRFKFRSPHHDPKEEEIALRKARLDAEIARERGEEALEPPQRVSFSKIRRAEKKKGNRSRNIRMVIILVILFALLYRGILWVETTDFKSILDTFKNG